MNVLIIAYYFPPVKSVGSDRPEKIGKFLRKQGHHVTVLTHSYTGTDLDQEHVIRVYDISHNMNRRGVRRFQWLFLRLFSQVLNRFGFYHTIYTFWKKKVKRYAGQIVSRVAPDVILATYPPVETLELGVFFSKNYDIPLIADFRDGLMFEPIESKRISAFLCIKKGYNNIEIEAVWHSTAVTAVSPVISDYFRDTYNHPRVVTIPNGYDPADFLDLPECDELRNDYFHIVYTGRFGLAESDRDVSAFFQAVREVAGDRTPLKPPIRVHLMGEFSRDELKLVEDLIKEGIVLTYSLKDKKIALAFQKKADLLLLVTSSRRKYMAPAKIYEYLHSGTPILALTRETYSEEIIRLTNTGWVVHPDNKKDIYDVLKKITGDPSFYKQKINNRKNIESFSWDQLITHFNYLISNLKKKD